MNDTFICLSCGTKITPSCNCSSIKCTKCKSSNLLTVDGYSKLLKREQKCSILCTYYKSPATVNNTKIELCIQTDNAINIHLLNKCPLNKW